MTCTLVGPYDMKLLSMRIRRRWSTVAGKPPPRQGASGYSSEAMAADAVALMDALGWRRAHLVGMSLGGAAPPGF